MCKKWIYELSVLDLLSSEISDAADAKSVQIEGAVILTARLRTCKIRRGALTSQDENSNWRDAWESKACVACIY